MKFVNSDVFLGVGVIEFEDGQGNGVGGVKKRKKVVTSFMDGPLLIL